MRERPEELREQMLVTRAQAGDELAFHGLVCIYAARLRYYLRKLVGNDAVEDVLQDVWLVVHRELRKLRSPASFRPWLYRIARSRACRQLRDHRPLHQIPEDVEVPDEKLRDDVWSAADAAHIHSSLKMLTEEHRDVLLLRFMETMPYEEIAHVLDINLGTVRSRIHYAKLALRRIMEEKSDD